MNEKCKRFEEKIFNKIGEKRKEILLPENKEYEEDFYERCHCLDDYSCNTFFLEQCYPLKNDPHLPNGELCAKVRGSRDLVWESQDPYNIQHLVSEIEQEKRPDDISNRVILRRCKTFGKKEAGEKVFKIRRKQQEIEDEIEDYLIGYSSYEHPPAIFDRGLRSTIEEIMTSDIPYGKRLESLLMLIGRDRKNVNDRISDIFKNTDKEGEVSCIHSAIKTTNLSELAKDMYEYQSLEGNKITTEISPIDHFRALRSWVHSITEYGLENILKDTLNEDDLTMAIGFNEDSQRQFVRALASTYPEVLKFLSVDILQDIHKRLEESVIGFDWSDQRFETVFYNYLEGCWVDTDMLSLCEELFYRHQVELFKKAAFYASNPEVLEEVYNETNHIEMHNHIRFRIWGKLADNMNTPDNILNNMTAYFTEMNPKKVIEEHSKSLQEIYDTLTILIDSRSLISKEVDDPYTSKKWEVSLDPNATTNKLINLRAKIRKALKERALSNIFT